MHFTDIFIKRPVLASVVSLALLILGVRAFDALDLREYPSITYPAVNITTTYVGASADLMQGFITAPLQQAVATSDGIDYIEATSSQGMSRITAYLRPDTDVNDAFVEITAKVAKVRKQLPSESDDPIVAKESGMGSDILLYISFSSTQMTPTQITEYLERVVRPVLSTVPGVGEAELRGERHFAIRVWLDAQRMAAFKLSASDVNNAIRANNFQSAAGKLQSKSTVLEVSAVTSISSVEEFGNLIVKQQGDSLVRLRDLAKIELGAENYGTQVSVNGQQSTFVSIVPAAGANPLNVGRRVKAVLPDIERQLPEGMSLSIIFDTSATIQHSIAEVVKTIFEAGVIVIIVIFLFLGSLRSVIIPVVTIPLSLIGALLLMLPMGFSVNLLTLLALVLAIGLVVDDAIVVVENIQRHIEEGMKPFEAALLGAREIAVPVIAMTITLAAVYAPIGLLGGLTGALFTEFAYTLAGAVIVSGVVALTLSPMMCSKLLRSEDSDHWLVHKLDLIFDGLKNRYQRWVHVTLLNRPVVVLFSAVVLISIVFLFLAVPQELAPEEDNGSVYVSGSGPLTSNIDYTLKYSKQIEQLMFGTEEVERGFIVNGAYGENALFGIGILKPWSERQRSAKEIEQELNAKFNQVAGMRVNAFLMSSLPGQSPDFPIKFLINSTASYQLIDQIAREVVEKARESGLFVYVDSNLKFNNPQLSLNIDRNKAAEMGVDMRSLGETLSTFLGESQSSRFELDGRSYKVILQAEADDRRVPGNLNDYFVNTLNGETVALSTFTDQQLIVQPNSLTEFQQLRSTSIGAMMAPTVSIADGIEFFEETGRQLLPKGFSFDFVGESRQFIEEGNKLIATFILSFILIYLVLAAQFESFTDPLIVLISVPMSVCGALIPLALGAPGLTMNIYTQIGLLTLIGLISKHGILIVDFANRLQQAEGLDIFEAVEKAAAVRLRPILMTTAAMVFGVMPLLLATGPGAESRFNIGLVITAGMSIGTLFTLFVVPTMYSFFATEHKRDSISEESTCLTD